MYVIVRSFRFQHFFPPNEGKNAFGEMFFVFLDENEDEKNAGLRLSLRGEEQKNDEIEKYK